MTGSVMALKEALRFLLGLLGFGGKVKGHEPVIWKQVPESGGLASSAGRRSGRALAASLQIVSGEPQHRAESTYAKYTIQSHILHEFIGCV